MFFRAWASADDRPGAGGAFHPLRDDGPRGAIGAVDRREASSDLLGPGMAARGQ